MEPRVNLFRDGLRIIEVDAKGDVVQLLGWGAARAVAVAAFDAAVPTFPHSRLELRHRARIIRRAQNGKVVSDFTEE